MSGPSDAEPLGRQDDTIKKVAYLYAKGEPQKRIAGLLSLSPSMVSRLVEQARQVGLVRETIECQISDSEQQRLEDEVYRGKELLGKLKDIAYDSGVGSLTQLQIVPTGLGIKTDESWDQAVSVFGHKAAPYCLTLLRGCEACKILGVTYGRTLAALASGLEEVTASQGRPKTPITCVPLWGEPLSPWEEPRSQVFRDPAKLSSSGLAADIHRILNGVTVKGSGRKQAQPPLHLSFVPAFQPNPARFSDDDFRAVLKFASSVSAYGQIFSLREGSLAEGASHEVQPKTGRQTKQSGGVEERKFPLVDHLDAILTSVGSKDQPGRFWSGEFFRQGHIDLPKLCRGAFGDLGGAFIINPPANQADREYVEAVNKRWTGIKEPHFRRCALRARENTLPGVTVLAVGAVRAKIVLQCLKLGLINHLILDTDCAQRLSRLVRSRSPRLE